MSQLDADLRRARRPGVLTVPDELLAGRRGFSSAAIVSMLALVVAVGCAFVLRVLWAERSASASEHPAAGAASVQVVGGTAGAATVRGSGPTRTPPAGAGDPTTGAPSRDGRAGAGDFAGTAGAAQPGGSVVVVHVVGQVNRPGLVQLRQGARVADAITAAGGTRRGADVSVLNLARLVQDGEQIRVPKPGETLVAAPGSGTSGGAASGASGGAAAAGAPVSLNAADAAALDALPGVGPVLAQRIVDWRTEHGRFTSVDELGEVSGIGDKLMVQLRPKVTL
ncbi:helix-hairpin-helix domain-containing protein [Terrabacter sp. BE26]|uniref:helix-hairpin-helix domain-containing protein n=1 Tax=Terrabacter sp. BE26 TaxID=2898152 RepID=UPI0035BE7B70